MSFEYSTPQPKNAFLKKNKQKLLGILYFILIINSLIVILNFLINLIGRP